MLLSNKHIPLTAQKNHTPAAPKAFAKGYFKCGLLLLILFAIQEFYDWRWAWLADLQAGNLYKQLSGFSLLTYLAHQWHCSVLRNRGLMRKAGRLLNHHKLAGSLAPVFFYAHSQSLGFTYAQILSLVYFAIFLTGLFNFETTHIRKPWYQSIWISIHVGLSTGLLFLLGYHIFISYAYQ